MLLVHSGSRGKFACVRWQRSTSDSSIGRASGKVLIQKRREKGSIGMGQNDEASCGRSPPHLGGATAERGGNLVIFSKREDPPCGHGEQTLPVERAMKAVRNPSALRHARAKKRDPPTHMERCAEGAEKNVTPGLRSHRAVVLAKSP
jgi:hypothetical protein